MIENTLKLVCAVGGAVLVTLALPELLDYAAPMAVMAYTAGIIVGGAGIRSILRG
jgi:hypothetical protein